MKKILVAVFTMVAGVALRAEVPLVPAYTEPVLEISVDSDTTLDQWLSDNGKTLDGVNTKALRKKFRDAGKSFPCVIAEADEIVGCPASTDEQWALSVSADGKKLLLEYRPMGLTVIVR